MSENERSSSHREPVILLEFIDQRLSSVRAGTYNLSFFQPDLPPDADDISAGSVFMQTMQEHAVPPAEPTRSIFVQRALERSFVGKGVSLLNITPADLDRAKAEWRRWYLEKNPPGGASPVLLRADLDSAATENDRHPPDQVIFDGASIVAAPHSDGATPADGGDLR